MGKHQNKSFDQDAKANKSHKTLRDKLRKRRQQLKSHKKQKSEKKKQYDILYKKSQYFSQGQNKNESKELKMKKIIKQIQKFINIYEDDLNDFYDMFGVLDKGGKIDISSLQNKAMMKCLKKLFKYLPLKKDNGQYVKNENSSICLEVMMKQKVSQCIEYYLENGSHQADSEQSSEDQKQQNKKQKKSKKDHKVKIPKEQDDDMSMGPIRLYKDIAVSDPEPNMMMGPFIPQSEKEQMAKLFQQQLAEIQKQREQFMIPKPSEEGQGDEFDQMFSMYQTRKEMKAPVKLPQEVPEHLMAAGSARLGQKVQVDQESIDEYNRINRPKKLIEVHKELMQSRGIEEQPNKRRAFSRERDVLGQGKSASFMKNSTFFDFRSKMTKPSNTNQFL